MNRADARRARELLIAHLAQIKEGGETEIFVSPGVAASLRGGEEGAARPRRAGDAPASPPPGDRASGVPARRCAAPRRDPETASVRPLGRGAGRPSETAPGRGAAPSGLRAGAPAAGAREGPEPEIVPVELTVLGRQASVDMFAERSPLDDSGTLSDVEKVAVVCTKCDLATGRTKVVFGTGDVNAKLMFVGEAPGRDEDLEGIPFVGRAGRLLDKILEAAEIERSDVYICNIIKCRPPNNRTPFTNEIEACMPYLARQLQFISPRVVCTLGLPATQTLLGIRGSMGSLRGKIYRAGDISVVPTYHPAAALRDPRYKRPIWEDFLIVKREYDRVRA